MQVLIRQAKIVDPRSEFHDKVVDLVIENGAVADIAPKLKTKANTIIEQEGLHASPGWIDIFADYAEPGHEQKETIATGLNAAAAGGFTDVLLTPNTTPSISSSSVAEFVLRKAKGHAVQLHPLGSVTQDIEGAKLSEMLDMHTHGAIAFTDGWQPVQNANLLLKALEYVKAFNGIIIQLPVDTTLSSGGLMHEGPVSTGLGMAGIPALAETLMIQRDIELLGYTDSRLHITGVSTAESVGLIRKAKDKGLDISCSVTPYHLALTDEVLKTYSSLYKVTPPLRSETDRKALIAGLKDGTIDCITSHHRPQEWDAKAREFEYAADGMNLQELMFSILWDTIGKQISLDRLLDAISIKPREIFGLSVDTIAKGSKTGLTLFTTAGTTTLKTENIHSKSRNNPFIGKELSGKVVGIINNDNIYLNK